MADDDQGVLGGLIQSEEPWALEETQKTIKTNWATYLSKHAKKDTKSLQEIAKNIDTLVNRGTAAEKTTLDELKKAKTSNQKDSATFNKLLGTTEKGNKKRHKNFQDLKQSVAESILKGNKQSSGMFSGFFTGVLDTFTGVAKGVRDFDGTMAGLAKTIGVVSAVAGGMIAWVANTTETYKSLVNVGQTFGGRMFDMNHAANRAGISLEQLAKVTIKHSKLMAFRVNAEKTGMNMFTQTQLEVRKNIRAFGNYGLTLDQVTEFTAGYLDQLRIQGRLDKMSNDSRILATTNYMRKLSELSEITGKSRDVLAEEMKSANENVNQWARSMTRQGAERENFIKAMENMNIGLGMFGKESADAFRQIVLQADQFAGNLAMTPVGAAILSMVPDVGDAMQQMANAVTSNRPEDVAEANAALLTSLKNLTEGEIDTLNMRALSQDAEAKMILKMGQEAGALRLDAEGLIIKAAKNRTKAEDEAAAKLALATEDAAQKATRAAMNFSDVSSEVMGQTKDLILTAFEKPLNNMVGYMGDAVTGIRNLVMDNKEFLTLMANKINDVGNSMTKDLGSLGTTVGVAAAAIVTATAAKGAIVRHGIRRGMSASQITEKVAAGKTAGRSAAGVASSELGEEALEALAKKSAKKAIWKALPVGIGAGAGLAFAAGRLMEGDLEGAALEAASGVAAIAPGAGTALGFVADAALLALDVQRLQEQGEAGARPKPGSPETEREAAGGRWISRRGKRVWVPDEGGPEAGAGEEPVASGMSSQELLAQLNEHMSKNNALLEGIGSATGATASSSKKTADALGGFNANNLQ